MKLLIVTRKIDIKDERVSFFTDWILEFAKHLDQLYIICQEKGNTTNLSDNITIKSLGKEKGRNKLFQLIAFYFFLFKFINKTDGVFTHMMPIYSILVGPWCKLFNKKLIQWYTHKNVNWKLKLANFWVNGFISANSESFRLKTKKPVYIFGHGINLKRFTIHDSRFTNNKFTILSVGRVSPTKNIDTLITVAEKINLNHPELRDKILFQIIGAPALKTDEKYYLELIKTVKEKNLNNLIDFLGPLPYADILEHYANCDLFINLSETGSLDKVVLEAMASKKIVLTSNEAFKNIVPEILFLKNNDPELLLKKIQEILALSTEQKTELQNLLFQEVEQNHNLENLVKKIIKVFEKQKRCQPIS
jgi:glycosyltransferase involved in cell wall biosynthesis